VAEVALVTDSTSSLEPAQAARAGVTVVPLQVVMDGRSRPETEVAAAEVAAALRAGRSVTTSRPTPEVLASTYSELARRGAASVVSVHLSSKISGTCAAAEQAATAAPVPVTVVDCGTLGMAAGFAVLAAAAAAGSGRPAEEVVRVARNRAAASTTYFYVDTLEFLRRGGRIGPAAALVGTALGVKPLLTVTGGEIRPLERVRTESRALARLQELAASALALVGGPSGHVDVAVHHLDNPVGAGRLVSRLRERIAGCEISVTEVSAVIGVHVGPGMLGVVISPRT
jgi:DegV family protein with EDD domain